MSEKFNVYDSHSSIKHFKYDIETIPVKGSKRNKKMPPPALTDSQLNIIKDALKSMDVKGKNHRLKIRVVGEERFKVTLDGKSQFLIASNKTMPKKIPGKHIYDKDIEVAGSSTGFSIRETFKPHTLLSTVTDAFRFVNNFFYQPAFPNAKLKDRSPKEAIIEDYRALRKGLQLGQSYTNKHSIQLKNSVQNAFKIEKAIKSNNSRKALDQLAKSYAKDIGRKIDKYEDVIIPTAYLNEDGVLQPVMLRFSNKLVGGASLEIYCDSAEGGAKTTLSHERKFRSHHVDDYYKVLQTLLNPLVPPETDAKFISKVAKPSATFEGLFVEKEQAILKGMGLAAKQEPIDEDEVKDSAKAKPPIKGLTFEGLLRSVDSQIGKNWEVPLWSSAELVAPAKTPMERVSNWINHLSFFREDNAANTKLDLLYSMTNKWADDQLKQLDGKVPIEKQLAILEEVLSHIDHTIGKIAFAINGGHTVDAKSIPIDLNKKREKCAEKVKALRVKIRKQQLEASGEQLTVKHTVDLKLPYTPPAAESALAGTEPVRAIPLNRVEWANNWQASKNSLAALVAPAQMQQYQVDQTLADLAAQLPNAQNIGTIAADQKQCKAYVNTTLEEMRTNGMLKGLIDHEKSVKTFTMGSDAEAATTELTNAISQLILCPHLIPPIDENHATLGSILFLMRKVQDPNSTFPSKLMPAVDQLRALLRMRHLIPKENIAAYEKEAWTNLAVDYKEKHPDLNPAQLASYNTLLQRAAIDGKTVENAARIAKGVVGSAKLAPTPQQAAASAHTFQTGLHKELVMLTEQCDHLMKVALSEPNLEKRRELLADVQQHSLQVLKMMPPPGTEGSSGANSIWNHLPDNLCEQASDQLSRLESLVWETQMRLGQSHLSGQDRFFLLKGQAIRQAIVRNAVTAAQNQVEKILSDVAKGNPMAARLGDFVSIDNDTKAISFDWNKIASEDIERLREFVSTRGSPPDVELLLLANFTLDTMQANELLSQDLTAQLSRDPAMEKELLAVYHFVARDKNRGVRDQLNSQPFSRQVLGQAESSMIAGVCANSERPTARYADQLAKSSLIQKMVNDPDFILSTSNAAVGVPYFEAKPDLLLRQNALEIVWNDDISEGKQAFIRGDNDQICAWVYPDGNPKTTGAYNIDSDGNASYVGVEGGLTPKQPFLPVVDNKGALLEITDDLRIHKKPDIWLKYVAEQAQLVPLSVSPQALQKLYLIRTAPLNSANKATVTAYGPDTAVNALAFISDPSNLKYLEHEFVQQYLEESLFGSFVMQQALSDYPTLVGAQIDLIGDRITDSKQTDKPQVTAFLNGVVNRVHGHAKLAEQSLANEGMLSGFINGSLPCHMDVTGGNVSKWSRQVSKFEPNQGLKVDPAILPKVNETEVAQPLAHNLEQLSACVAKLERIQATHPTSSQQVYFEGEKGDRVIDQIKKPAALRQNYSLALTDYKCQWEAGGAKNLKANDYLNILEGYRHLNNPNIEEGLGETSRQLNMWVREEVLPAFGRLPSPDRNLVCTDLANNLLKEFKLPLVKAGGAWQPSGKSPTRYTLTTTDRKLEIDLANISLPGVGEIQTKRSTKPIPNDILKREDVQKALKTDKVIAEMSKRDGATHYVWTHEGQTFDLKVIGKEVSIYREISGTHYTFQPINIEDASGSSQRMLADNGIWTAEGSSAGVIYTSGMNKPSDRTTYSVVIETTTQKKQSQASTHIQRIETSTGEVVSCSENEKEVSPLLFVKSEDVIILVDKSGRKPTKMRLRDSNIEFVKNGEQWVCSQSGRELGILSEPSDETLCRSYFGANWSEFVIPLQNSDGSTKFLLLPYEQNVDRKGMAHAAQTNLSSIPKPEVCSIQQDGTIKTSIAGDLYLANHLLHQAANMKNSVDAQELFRQIDKHIEQLTNQRLPSGADQLASIAHCINLISSNPAVSLVPVPKPAALALQIRLTLAARRLRAEGGAEFSLSTQADHDEMEQLSKMYKSYLVMGKQFSVTNDAETNKKIEKTGLAINGKDRADLCRIQDRLLQSMPHPLLQHLAFPTVTKHFGATGRVATKVTLNRPDHVDPQFLLTLVRAAKKPPKDPINMLAITAPLPLDDLLENFWGYMLSIKENDYKPEDLMFLFQPSVMPAAKSEEEEAQFRLVDEHARQFLLSYADVQKLCGGADFKPKEWLEQKIDRSKEVGADVERFNPVLGQMRNDWRQQAEGVTNSLNQLKVNGIPTKIDETRSVELPDTEKFQKDLKDLEVQIQGFSSELNQAVVEAEQFVSKHRNEWVEKKKEITKLETEKERITSNLAETIQGLRDSFSGPALQQQEESVLSQSREKMVKVNDQINAKTQELDMFLAQQVRDPVRGTMITVSDVTSGPYEKDVNLAMLKEVANTYSKIQKDMTKAIKQSRKVGALFNGWVTMEKMFSDLQTKPFKPQPNIRFPEGGKRKEIFNALLDPDRPSNKEIVKRVVGDLGPLQGPKFLKEMHGYQKGGLSSKLKLFAGPLEGLAYAGRIFKDLGPVEVLPINPEDKHAGRNHIVPGATADDPLTIQMDQSNRLFNNYFTLAQKRQLYERLKDLPQAEQQSVLERLSEALQTSEKFVAAQIQTGENIDLINNVCHDAASRTKSNLSNPIQIPQLTDSFDTHFKEHFQVQSTDLSQIKLSEFQAMTAQTKITQTIKEIVGGSHDEQQLTERFKNPELLPIAKALSVVMWAQSHQAGLSPDAQQALDKYLKPAVHPNLPQQLAALQQIHQQLDQPVFDARHLVLAQELIDSTLPDQADSLYAQDLEKGFQNLKVNNPIPYAEVIGSNHLDAVGVKLAIQIENLQNTISSQEKEIALKLRSMPPGTAPKTVRQALFRNCTDRELLDTAYKAHGQAAFGQSKDAKLDEATVLRQIQAIFSNCADPAAILDEAIALCQINVTQLKLLKGGKFNASSSLQRLQSLDGARQQLIRDYAQCHTAQEQRDVKAKLEAIEITYARESSRFKDCTGRCQSTEHLTALPNKLKPHARKIIYLQNRLGLVLRQDQIDALNEMVSNPSLLKQLRMGLGKTSILLPFALEILISEGHNVMGMVPRALFKTNFDEMDETTRVVFELAGCQFLFSRQDAPQPLSPLVLGQISEKCGDFFRALDNRQFILTTIESKASLDDKIIEVEMSRHTLQSQVDGLKDNKSDEAKLQRASLEQNMLQHNTVLDMLYRVKWTFHNENTRLIIDEADQVGRANYSINSEIGGKQGPVEVLRNTTSTVFGYIRDHEKLKTLREEIFANNQYTLTSEVVDAHLRMLGGIWLEERKGDLPAQFRDPKQMEAIQNWLAGAPSPFTPVTVQQLGPIAQELKVLRKTLNSGVRSALALKVGLSADFDPVHNAVGIPASQGVTSPTTRFSDPLMQLSLANMIAMYKPQGEGFLKGAAGEVLERAQKKAEDLKGSEKALYQKAAKNLQTLLEAQKSNQNPDFSAALCGPEAWKVALRQEYATQAALNQLIYVTEGQIARPAQHALRGCNIIGLTGTATRNLGHVITSNGNANAMKSVEASGRESTAEVIYRLAKSLPDGLKTPVGTYSPNSDKALEEFKGFAKENSGYNFLVNQAGACDRFSQKEIVTSLHSSGRPIVYLSLETGAKSALIDGVVKRLEDLSPPERSLIQTKGFYYYHTPHVRGTHFDIPTGSKGALMLSPKVNANDRDQAAYRARELGEGHVVQPFISELQHKEIATKNSSPVVTLQHVLKANHNQTFSDEGTEDLAAFQLHIQGQLTHAAEEAKLRLQTAGRLSHAGEQLPGDQRELYSIKGRDEIATLFENFFVQEGGNEGYLNQLDQELYQGGHVPTRSKLLSSVNSQIARADRLLDQLKKLNHKEVVGYYRADKVAIQEILGAKIELVSLKNDLENDEEWGAIEKQLPATVAASPASQETAETEAEEEAQEEQEVQAETMGEKDAQKRAAASKTILTKVDHELLGGITSDYTGGSISKDGLYSLALDKHPKSVTPLWKTGMFISNRLQHQLKYSMGTGMPDMRLIIMKPEKPDSNGQLRNVIALADPQEGHSATGFQDWWELTDEGTSQEGIKPMNGCTVRPTIENDGSLKLVYQTAPPTMKGIANDFDNDKHLQAEIIFTLLHVGVSQLTEDQLTLLNTHWKQLSQKERGDLHSSLEKSMGQTNPKFFSQLITRLNN